MANIPPMLLWLFLAVLLNGIVLVGLWRTRRRLRRLDRQAQELMARYMALESHLFPLLYQLQSQANDVDADWLGAELKQYVGLSRPASGVPRRRDRRD